MKKKRCWGPKTKIRQSKNAYNYCRFWRMLMIIMVEERWRTFSFWAWQGLQQHFEAQAMRDEHDALRNFEFPGGHSNILKNAESRMWTAPQTCSKKEGRQREAKPRYPKRLLFIARTPKLTSNCLGNCWLRKQDSGFDVSKTFLGQEIETLDRQVYRQPRPSRRLRPSRRPRPSRRQRQSRRPLPSLRPQLL